MTHLLNKAIGAATVSCLLFGSYVGVREQIVKESSMEGIQQLPPLAEKCSNATPIPVIQSPIEKPEPPPTKSAGRFQGLGEKKNIKKALPETVKAGDPVLHEPAREVQPEEIGSDRIQKIIDDMVKVMRAAGGVGLAAPQLGIPLKIIVLEDTEELIGYAPKEYTKALARQPFDLLVIINPNLLVKGNKSALFFEGCLSVDGFGAMVERFLEVEVTGLDRYGQPIKVVASGWQARILQHECDHLEGTLYVDKMIRKTFRTVENAQLPLASGCPKPGVREQFGQNY